MASIKISEDKTELESADKFVLPEISPATNEDVIAYLRRSHKIAEVATLVFKECISDRRNPQIALQSEEELQLTKLLMERVADAVFWVKPDARFLYVNDTACSWVGYSREELLSMTMHDVDPNFSPTVWSEYWRTIKQQGSLSFESLHRTKQGQSFPVEITFTYLECNGREYGYISSRDISKRKQTEVALYKANETLERRVQELTAKLSDAHERLYREIAKRKRTEAELKNSLSLLQTTLESTVDGVIAVSCKGDIVSFNHKFVEMWQVPDSIIRSHNYNQCLAFYRNQLKDPETFCKRVRELDSQLEIEGYDTLELKDGRVFEGYCQPQRLGEQIVGRVWSFRDITKRKQAEVEIRQTLEREKELGELRTRFVSMVSHEFRTPLNIISFSTSLLKRHSCKWTEEKKQLYLHRIQTSVEQLSELMDGVLIIGRAEAGKLIFEPIALALDQFCRDLVAQLQLSDNSSQHTISFVCQGDCRAARVDEKLLQPILTNLLSNAIKYSPASSTVELALSCQDGEAIFQIKDEGIGIPAADRQRLFEPFHRGGNVGDIPGTGLGLAVVEKLVDIHGGQIAVASEVGVGTTFTIVLPLGQLAEARASTPLVSTNSSPHS